MKKIALRTIAILTTLYLLVCGFLYFFQERLIFFPDKMDKNQPFRFEQKFEEVNTPANDETLISSLLFRADSTRGVIYYLHGNGGSLRSWGSVAKTYTDMGYDVFMTDYRGYGKSGGTISSEDQLYDDLQAVYNNIKNRYAENSIIVLGYSIGTGPAAKIASANKPRMLILQAPYYSLVDMMRHRFRFVPTFLLKYKFRTYEFIKECKMPVVIFHGRQDQVISFKASTKLKEEFKPTDTLIALDHQGHNGMSYNTEYCQALKYILNR